MPWGTTPGSDRLTPMCRSGRAVIDSLRISSDYLTMVRFGPDGDPRRLGLAAAGVSGGYVVALFVPGSVGKRVGLALLFGVGMVVLMMRVPLPPWRESDDRRQTAMSAMVVESAMVCVVATFVHLWLG